MLKAKQFGAYRGSYNFCISSFDNESLTLFQSFDLKKPKFIWLKMELNVVFRQINDRVLKKKYAINMQDK